MLRSVGREVRVTSIEVPHDCGCAPTREGVVDSRFWIELHFEDSSEQLMRAYTACGLHISVILRVVRCGIELEFADETQARRATIIWEFFGSVVEIDQLALLDDLRHLCRV